MDEDGRNEIERRFQRNIYIVIVIALLAGFVWGGKRMGLGVLLGGVLSLFNKRWLEGSVRAIMSRAVVMGSGRVPPWTASKLILRYFIVGFVIIAAVSSGVFHPLGIAIGFGAFVAGVMIEAGYQIYIYFKNREYSAKE